MNPNTCGGNCDCKGACGKCGGGCRGKFISKTLVIIGAINWGLIGIGYFFDMNLNIVNKLLGTVPTAEAIVYILVGLGAVMMVCKCGCKKCVASCSCEMESSVASKSETPADQTSASI